MKTKEPDDLERRRQRKRAEIKTQLDEQLHELARCSRNSFDTQLAIVLRSIVELLP